MSTSTELVITVTNDGVSDRRMRRLADLLRVHGWSVTIVGRIFSSDSRTSEQGIVQIPCDRRKGPAAYWEYHQKLLTYLRRQKPDIICAVDYDTLTAGVLAARTCGAKLIFDSHEFFEEVPELTGRLLKKWVWRKVAQRGIPKTDLRWTVSHEIADALKDRYGMPFEVIRNMPSKYEIDPQPREQALVYLGVLNEGRGLPQLIKAMHQVDATLWLIGEGDLSQSLRTLVADQGLSGKIEFLGWLPEASHREWLARARVGLNLLDTSSMSYRYSLANKFFDYVHAGLPQLTMNLSTYRSLNDQYEVAKLLDHLEPTAIAHGIAEILNSETWQHLHEQTLTAREYWNWEQEAKKVLVSLEKINSHFG